MTRRAASQVPVREPVGTLFDNVRNGFLMLNRGGDNAPSPAVGSRSCDGLGGCTVRLGVSDKLQYLVIFFSAPPASLSGAVQP